MNFPTKKTVLVLSAFAIIVWYGASSLYAKYLTTALDENGLPKGHISFEFISSREEAKLQYPGAEVYYSYGKGGNERANNRTGWAIAFVGEIMTSTSSPELIYDWYENWLSEHGWHKDDRVITGSLSAEISHISYARNGAGRGARESFLVTVYQPNRIARILGLPPAADELTVYEYRYSIKSADQTRIVCELSDPEWCPEGPS